MQLVTYNDKYLWTYSSILQGKSSHKFIDLSGNPIMKIYYESKLVLGFMCMTNELFYAGLYIYHFTPGPMSKFCLAHKYKMKNF